MKEIKQPIGLYLEDKTLTFGEVYNLFSASSYGAILNQQVRYARYKPEEVGNMEWENLLRVDVNNLKHLSLTYGLARKFLHYCASPPSSWFKEIPAMAQFSEADETMLLLTAITHDWAEALVGDTMFDLKTGLEEQEEETVLGKIILEFFKPLIKGEGLNPIIKAVGDIIKDRGSKLGQAFNAIERLGYLRTGLRAWQKAKEIGPVHNQKLATHLLCLTNNVFLNQIPKLLEYSEIYPPVWLYLSNMKAIISQVFTEMPSNSFSMYNQLKESEEKKSRFEEAKQLWFSTLPIFS